MEEFIPQVKKKKMYCDNNKFLELLADFKETGVISEELGELYFTLVTNLTYARQFINYSESWKNEMVSDALYNFCRYTKTYDIEKGKNPFGYFTTIAFNAFKMRINREKFKLDQEGSMREELYNEFLNDYKLHTGTDIKNTDDCIFLEQESNDD